MLHDNRVWCVSRVEDAEELAQKLTEITWCCCAGFSLNGYWFLNDATSEDGGQEYAVVKIEGPEGKPVQIESITISWCSYEQALRHIEKSIAGEYDESGFAWTVDPAVETPEKHQRCPLCA